MWMSIVVILCGKFESLVLFHSYNLIYKHRRVILENLYVLKGKRIIVAKCWYLVNIFWELPILHKFLSVHRFKASVIDFLRHYLWVSFLVQCWVLTLPFRRYNIRYGKVPAPDEDVDQAADAADIHQKVLTLKDGMWLIGYLTHY